jgi:hypothetical protein
MSYANFIPNVWVEGIERDLPKKSTFMEDCNRKFEGKITKLGESVSVIGVGKPSVYTINRERAGDQITPPEVLADVSSTMIINQMSYFNYMVGDVDKVQAMDGLQEALQSETSDNVASTIDAHIAACSLDKSITRLHGTSPKKMVIGKPTEGEANVLHVIEDAVTMLYKRNVAMSTRVVANVSPDFYKLVCRELGYRDTDNSKLLEDAIVKRYGNVFIKMSNNVAAEGGVEHIMLRTPYAVAFALAHTHVEAYRPEGYFADAVKGFHLYQAKVMRSKEIVDLNVTY